MEGTLYTKDYRTFQMIDENGNIIWEGEDAHKLLKGDQVRILHDNKLELVQQTVHKNIVGILQTSSKLRHGIDKRGHIIYVFRPIDLGYPEFLVASNLKNQLANQWCVVDMIDWPNVSKRPRGGVQHYLGEVGNYAVELEALYRHYRPKPVESKIWKKEYQQQLEDIAAKYQDGNWKLGREYIDEKVISIDPAGCKDIDDAISIKQLSENIWQLSIHIADVSCWIDETSILDRIAQELGSTLYGVDSNFPIFPRELSEGIFSLLPDMERATITLKITIDKGQIINRTFCKSYIKNSRALDYEYYMNETGIQWNNLFRCAEILAESLGLPFINNDSHKLVEILMIYYNWALAQMGSGIYRVQSAGDLNREYPLEIRFLGLEAAEYSLKAIGHHSIGLKYYTHATSPIRRYADLLVQRYIINSKSISEAVIRDLNRNQKHSKRFHRDIQFIRAIYEDHRREVQCIILDNEYGYILDWGQRVRFQNNLEKFVKVVLRYWIDPNPIQWKKRIVFQQQS